MSKKRLDVSWERQVGKEDFKPALKRYDRYLEENGIRESTRYSYVFRRPGERRSFKGMYTRSGKLL